MRKKCPYCGKHFKSNEKLGSRQPTCQEEECRRAHRRDYKKQWWHKNKNIYNPNYEATKSCPSRQPAARATYRKQDRVKKKQAEYMRHYRKRKRVEQGKCVRCTDIDISISPHQEPDSAIAASGLRVRCTDTDISISPVLIGHLERNRSVIWSVRCTNIDGVRRQVKGRLPAG